MRIIITAVHMHYTFILYFFSKPSYVKKTKLINTLSVFVINKN